VSWLLGDAMKMSYLFYTKDVIPSAFKMCAIFQCFCDCYLGIQYWMFGQGWRSAAGSMRENGQPWGSEEKDIRLT
jgi:3'-phosphoadenosine 5'-phosphosulfate (PAPS) 3'-phosphatase